jgi:hypothetical protein
MLYALKCFFNNIFLLIKKKKKKMISSIDGNAFFGGMMEFFEFIANLILEDFLSEGNVYTWSNNQDPLLLYQIDAFLALVR